MNQAAEDIDALLPLFAPLSRKVVEHLVAVYKARTAMQPDAPLSLMALEPDVRRYRAQVYAMMAPAVVNGAVKAGWLQQAVTDIHGEGAATLSTSTLAYWRGKGLIRSRGHGQFEATSAAAFLLSRLMTRGIDEERERNLFPPQIDEEEPRWWCWAQRSPQDQPFPSPVPFAADLPASTLLWTPWAGAEWDLSWEQAHSWMRINTVGAIRWAGVRRQGQEPLWDISVEALRAWDPEAAALDVPALERATRILQIIADLALIRLASQRFTVAGE